MPVLPNGLVIPYGMVSGQGFGGPGGIFMGNPRRPQPGMSFFPVPSGGQQAPAPGNAVTGAPQRPPIPSGQASQLQAFAAQRARQPGGARLAGMQQGMSTGTPSQNLQGVAPQPGDLVTNRRRGVLSGLF